MMSTAEEVKAEMFGDDPSAGHHEVVVGRYSPGRTETGSAVAEYRSQTMWTNWWASLWILPRPGCGRPADCCPGDQPIHVVSNSGLKAGGQGNVTTPPQPQPH
jgi:disulfide bond formation protein DsbB